MLFGRVKFTGRLWRNGEFGVSRVREYEPEQFKPKQSESEETSWRLGIIREHGIEDALAFARENYATPAVPLGSSQVAKPHTRSRRGLKGITSHGRKVVRNAAEHLQKEYGLSRLTFLTLTVPSCTAEQARSVAEAWGEIVRVLLQRLGRSLGRQGLRGGIVAVTEIQEQRYASSGVPVLHLHLAFCGRQKGKAWAVTPDEVREMWRSALGKHLPDDTYWGACENMQRVRKSVSGYLGKYLSKGAAAIASIRDAGLSDYLPSAWWNCTYELRRLVLSQVLTGTQVGDFLEYICSRQLSEFFSYLKPIEIACGDGFKFVVGYAGRLHPSWCDEIYQRISDGTIDMVC